MSHLAAVMRAVSLLLALSTEYVLTLRLTVFCFCISLSSWRTMSALLRDTARARAVCREGQKVQLVYLPG